MKINIVPIIAIVISLGLVTSFTFTGIPMQIAKSEPEEKCTTFERTDGLLTSERCTVQGRDPSITDTTCTEGVCTSSETENPTNKEVAQAKSGSKQFCQELTRDPAPVYPYTCTTD